jgi:hypothetical protein
MFLVCPIDANGRLVENCRMDIHKYWIAVRIGAAESALALVLESCTVCS